MWQEQYKNTFDLRNGKFTIKKDDATLKRLELACHLSRNGAKILKKAADASKAKQTVTKFLLMIQRGPFYATLYTIKGCISTFMIIWLYLKGKKHLTTSQKNQ